MYVTVDLDDTLISTQQDYDEAINKFGDWISGQTNVDFNTVVDRLNEVDRENISNYGLSKERFPASFEVTAQEFLHELSEEDRLHARELAKTAFKSEEEYRNRGFREGANILLGRLNHADMTTHLITAGDKTVQKRKIEALELNKRFDEIDIVGLGEKEETLRSIQQRHPNEEIRHIGNSFSSDVTAAAEAGVPAVYIPDNEWRQNEHTEIEQYDQIYVFDSIPELLDNFKCVFDTPVNKSHR